MEEEKNEGKWMAVLFLVVSSFCLYNQSLSKWVIVTCYLQGEVKNYCLTKMQNYAHKRIRQGDHYYLSSYSGSLINKN